MDKQETKKGRDLTYEEEKELREGDALYEMTQNNPGWKIVEGILKNLAYHSWVDPRECKDEKEFQWREINAFHAANNAKELLETIQKMVSRAEYLGKVKSGEIQNRTMRI